ncbi:flavodoxin-dependent (E)-4-hydroxy-3-methylbut-2-enyl-diphosphate synthase [Heliophilum fasciatum]|uniref:4-hydroxy-3-methylbut-2-en-1-yl diphosphate synthase (flavodoxin) n=1 Tax=Heliophilum fasciatum TaxID=35700 RepID=A0A4R2RQ57_9FIRM|nr:flavodoxin-dependent (E)-4-hydroxy-3-methylbut-2-enyl-diphosphate synthase [Heliophilum fasciatum]MCW2277903.1 (E)-4-hydroxy-3-methylbut-2-enyl-diphosphate synthase [Heliophilum fasciatum]TCP64527.1 4-hydroxy-3-methylbut-2-en-1-yl diphosphate synthase [Heliophilum fasciatum]
MERTFPRRPTRQIQLGSVAIGGNAPVSVQSMCNTDTRDPQTTLSQIEQLVAVGCEIVRVAVPDEQAAEALAAIVAGSAIPVIADIHFDYRLAIASLRAGVHGLRLNPGNIGGTEKVKAVLDVAKERQVPIRIGVNAGSLEKSLLVKYGGVTPEAMVESALAHIHLLEECNYPWMKISLKASSVPLMVQAYQALSQVVDYPMHVGVTEAGTIRSGVVKSAVGIGALLAQGIGDTIRVSLTGDPVPEVTTGWQILSSLGLRHRGPELISCPTCGRCQIALASVAEAVEQALLAETRPIKVAVMGCVVNGPGEARDADVGIAGGKDCGLLFRKGEVVRKVPQDQLVEALLAEIDRLPGGDT